MLAFPGSSVLSLQYTTIQLLHSFSPCPFQTVLDFVLRLIKPRIRTAKAFRVYPDAGTIDHSTFVM